MDNIKKMEKIRERNNVLWMKILRIAFESNPKDTKVIIEKISDNDNDVKNIFKEMIK